MRNRALSLAVVLIVLLLVSACTSKPAVPNDAPDGMWSGNYELSSDRRESISVDLQWEGENLRGVVHAGQRPLPITKASFKPDTGAIRMEFDAEGPGGRTVHYVIDGKVTGNMMTGTWSHDDQHGDFRVTKQ